MQINLVIITEIMEIWKRKNLVECIVLGQLEGYKLPWYFAPRQHYATPVLGKIL
jgi:hypothetical protein